MKMKTKKKGFTLIELLVCLFIIGLMMLLIIPNIAKQREEAKKKSDAAIVHIVENQKQSYMLDKNTNTIPTVDELLKEHYIDQKQLDAYNKADKTAAENNQH